jgi:hypothetical protein
MTLGKASGSDINGVQRACTGFMGRVDWVAVDWEARGECANVVAGPTVVASARLSDVLFCTQDRVRCLLQCVQVSIPLVIYCHTGLAQKDTNLSLHRFFRGSESCGEAGPDPLDWKIQWLSLLLNHRCFNQFTRFNGFVALRCPERILSENS